jgi:hypothetical protein
MYNSVVYKQNDRQHPYNRNFQTVTFRRIRVTIVAMEKP